MIAHCSFAAACCCCCDIHCRLTATYTADFPSNFTCTWLYNSSDYLQFSCLSRARCWTPNNGNVHADTVPFPVAPFATCTVHHNVSPCDQYHFGLSFLLHGSFPLYFCLTKPRPPRTRPACPYLPGDTAATRSSIRHSFILLYWPVPVMGHLSEMHVPEGDRGAAGRHRRPYRGPRGQLACGRKSGEWRLRIFGFLVRLLFVAKL